MTKSTSVRIASLALATAVVAAASFAQGGNTLQGKAALPNGVPPANPVKVTLMFSGRPVYETFTDLSGRFFFSGLRRGRYLLIAEGDGQTFETTRVDAEVVALGSSPQTITQNIQLRPRAAKTVLPSGVVSAHVFDPNVPQRAREAYEKGLKRAEADKPEQAVKLLQEAVAVYPQFYSALVALGEQFDKLKRYPEAEAAYQKAVELKRDAAAPHAGLGVVLVKQKKYAEAIPPLRRGIEIDKQSSAQYLFLGLAEMMVGDYEPAESNLLRAYEIGKPTIAHIYLANLYDLQRRPAKAIEHLQAFLKENPESPNAGQIREAIEKLRRQVAIKK
jgi:tetratricopeptide (TPR) repeat protein